MSNASPLVVLAKISRVLLLALLCGELVVPAAVAEEILAKQRGELESVRPVLAELNAAGLYPTSEWITSTLEQAGE